MEQQKKVFSGKSSAAENLSRLIDVTTDKVKQLASASSVAGDTIYLDDSAVIPISKVSAGFAGGSGDLLNAEKRSANGGAGAGAKVSVTPVAFIVKEEGKINIVGVPEDGEESGSAASGILSGLLSTGLSALAAKKAQKGDKKEKTDTEVTVSEQDENGKKVTQKRVKKHSETK